MERARRDRRPLSVGLEGNAAVVVRELLRRGVAVDIVTDQTSAHDPLAYLPADCAVEDWHRERERDPTAFTGRARTSMAAHVEAMLDGSDAIADWPLLNAMVNVADGTALAAAKLERVLTNDPATGLLRHVDAGYPQADVVADDGRCVLPSFVDSHSHVVFGGERSEEFAARMARAPYAAGGIRATMPAPCSPPGRTPGSGHGCTPTSSATGRACSSRARWVLHPPTTAPT